MLDMALVSMFNCEKPLVDCQQTIGIADFHPDPFATLGPNITTDLDTISVVFGFGICSRLKNS